MVCSLENLVDQRRRNGGAGGLQTISLPDAPLRELGSRHASVHLLYQSPVGPDPVRSWYTELTPKHSSESTFFATNGHAFGYLGLQQVEKCGHWFRGQAIFSLWDQTCTAEETCAEDREATIVECGRDAVCKGFSGEGEGRKSTVSFNEWELEQTYGFVVGAFLVGEGVVRYDGYFHAPELGGWQLLAKIKVHIGNNPWYLHNLYSFVEQWDEESFKRTRWARFGPSFVEDDKTPGKWTQITSASFSHTDAEGEVLAHLHAEITGDSNQWGLGMGKPFSTSVAKGMVLTVDGASALPTTLVEFGDLRDNGKLPRGCDGKTCFDTLILDYLRKAHDMLRWPLFIALCLMTAFTLYMVALMVYKILGRRKIFEEEERSQSGGSTHQSGGSTHRSSESRTLETESQENRGEWFACPTGVAQKSSVSATSTHQCVLGLYTYPDISHLPLGNFVEAYSNAVISYTSALSGLIGRVHGLVQGYLPAPTRESCATVGPIQPPLCAQSLGEVASERTRLEHAIPGGHVHHPLFGTASINPPPDPASSQL